MIPSQNVIDVVDSSRSEPDFGEIRRPHTSISVLSLLLRVVRSVDTVVDQSVTVLPFLIVILFEMVMCRVN